MTRQRVYRMPTQQPGGPITVQVWDPPNPENGFACTLENQFVIATPVPRSAPVAIPFAWVNDPAPVPATEYMLLDLPAGDLALADAPTIPPALTNTLPQTMDSPPAMAGSDEDTGLSSQLSSHGSSEFGDDIKADDHEQALEPEGTNLMPPAKKRRTALYSHQSTPIPRHEDPEDLGEISSDTSGSIPASPTGDRILGFPDDDTPAVEQVILCRWKDCPAGHLGDQDELVKHLIEKHVVGGSKKYICEWEGCNRKEISSTTHASAYALKAHVRSHTKEKPFYCRLPECDRSFTRTDAQVKHERTVHGLPPGESDRASDANSKAHQSVPPKPQRLKLIVGAKPRDNNEDAEVDENATIASTSDQEADPAAPFEWPTDVHFTEEEKTMDPKQLHSLCRRQVHWSEQDGIKLRAEVEATGKKKMVEWQKKELVLDNVVEADLAYAAKNGMSTQELEVHAQDLPPPDKMLPLVGPQPWYRSEEGTANEGNAGKEDV